MAKAIKAQANGAATDKKFAAKIEANGITASERSTVTQALGPLQTLAVASSLIAKTMIEVAEQALGVQQAIVQPATALTKAASAGQSGKTSDAFRMCEVVLPEIIAATATLEQLASKQLAFWNDISHRVGILHVLSEMIDAQVKSRANSES